MSVNNRRGIVWTFFDTVDVVNKEAECKLCNNIYKYKGSSHNLKLHLKFKHRDVFMSLPESARDDRRSDRRSDSSGVWLYFKPIDGSEKRATCLACQKDCSYKTTIANLKTHLRLMHIELYEQMLAGDETEYILEQDEDDHRSSEFHNEDAEEEGSTNAWSYYEREAGGRARCVVCRMVVSRADLKAHLKANHPKLVAAVDLGSDDDASDSQEDVYTEIVYLEEENAKQRKSISKQNIKSEPYTERPEPRKRQASSSSDEAALKRKKYITDDKQRDNNDEIEQFGKYVTCLLKKIPAEACMELQAEIINLIMKKQLELKRKETSVLAGNKMAATASDTGSKVEFENTPSTSSFNISNGGTE